MPSRPLRARIFLETQPTESHTRHIFSIHIDQSKPRPWQANQIVKEITIPPHFVEKPLLEHDPRLRFGSITYLVENGHACGHYYYPKGDNREGVAPGLAAFFEQFCVEHLKKIGCKTIETAFGVSQSREKQLKRLKLKPETVYPIDEWLAALKKGVTKRKLRVTS